MPNDASPSPTGSSSMYIPTTSHLPAVDLSYSPTTSKNPINTLSRFSPTPSLSSLVNPPMDTSDDIAEPLYTWTAQSLDLFIKDLAVSLKKYHSPKFDAIALLDNYGLQNSQLWERSADFQARLLAVLACWKTPHVKGIWLVSLNEELPPFCIHPPCPEILSILYKGEDLYSFSHAYLLQLGHIMLTLHQILDELATLKENPQGFVFDPEFKALRSLKGLSDLSLLKVTWGVLMFRARKAHEQISHKLHAHHIALTQIEGVSIQEPIHKWLQNLPKPLPAAPSHVYRSNLDPVMSVPAILPSITTPHPVQVHFATTNPSTSVYLPGFGTVEDTQGVGEPTGPSLLLMIHRNTVTTSPPCVHLINDRTMTARGAYLLVLKGNNLNPHEIRTLIPWMTIQINEEDLAEEDLEETEEDLGEMVEVTEVGLEALEEETGDSDEVQGKIGVLGDHSIRFTFQNGDTNEDSSLITCTSDEEESSSTNCLSNGYCGGSVMLSFSTWKKLKLKQSYAVTYSTNVLAPGEPTFSMNIHAPSANYWNISRQQSAFLAYEYSEDESSNPLHNVSELLSDSAFEQAEGLAVDYKRRKPAKSSTKQALYTSIANVSISLCGILSPNVSTHKVNETPRIFVK
ncbi:hypothetical protein BDN71DRAFT_1427443 [Pleurotus eryngii]|uniref:Uncharacterized protein n=1 Tax=Pleurotus eryngii TaxID=5323 RepID=A0A9P6A582_PLEER|nr:hypothetical protein BDN71DRAFT_1427443 [Pleurotus eryngii]